MFSMPNWVPLRWAHVEDVNREALFKWQDSVGSDRALPVGVSLQDSAELVGYEWPRGGTDMRLDLARRGTGKTVIEEAHAGFHFLLGHAIIVFAREDEYQAMQAPLQDERAIEQLRQFDFVPMAFPVQTFRPLEKGFVFPDPFDPEYSLQEREWLVSSLLGLTSEPQMLALVSSLAEGPKDLGGLAQAFKVFKQGTEGETVGQIAGKIKRIVLMQKELGFKFGKRSDLLEALQGPVILNFVGSMKGNTGSLMRYMAAWFSVNISKHRDELASPLTIREEASEFLSTPSGASLIEEEINQGRKTGGHYAYVFQDLEKLKEERSVVSSMVKSCSIIMPSLGSPHTEQIAEKRGLHGEKLEALLSLQEEDSAPVQHGLISLTGKVDKVRPLACFNLLRTVFTGRRVA